LGEGPPSAVNLFDQLVCVESRFREYF
jgi:hypothetical protein